MANSNTDKLTLLLRSALEEKSRRKALLAEFQRIVWDAPPDFFIRAEEEIFGDLAYDLDFYEPNVNARQEDESYYGDDRLEEIIEHALRELDGLHQS